MFKKDYSANIERFTGFADIYDQHRPHPPAILGELLPRIARTPRPNLVVDIGSGTGLSTRFWADKAQAVVGVEPSSSMREEAEKTPLPGVSYLMGFSHATSLPEACADIVCCSQSLHWMEPEGTFREARRILREGGVFAAYDYDWPPVTGFWEADHAFERCMLKCRVMEKQEKLSRKLQQWDKPGHLERMKKSNAFRYVRQVDLHHTDTGNAERLLGVLFSQGYIQTLLKTGFTEKQLGIEELREKLHKIMGDQESSWLWSSRLRYGVV